MTTPTLVVGGVAHAGQVDLAAIEKELGVDAT